MSTIADIGKIWCKISSTEFSSTMFFQHVIIIWWIIPYFKELYWIWAVEIRSFDFQNSKKSFCESIWGKKVEGNQETIFENRKCH